MSSDWSDTMVWFGQMSNIAVSFFYHPIYMILVQIIKSLHGNQILGELQEEKYFNKCAACENKLGNNSILHVEFSTIYLLIKLVAVAATFLVTNHSSPSGS